MQVLLSPPIRQVHHLELVAKDGEVVSNAPPHGRTLTGESPLIVLPGLACEVGLPESVFLQQLHYWLTSGHAHERDGLKWIYNSLDQWQAQFPFWKKSTIHDITKRLEAKGVIVGTSKYNQRKTDRTKWYTINYDHPCLAGLKDSVRTISGIPEMQVAKSGNAFPENPISISGIPEMLIGTETTTETTNEESTPLVVPQIDEATSKPVATLDSSKPIIIPRPKPTPKPRSEKQRAHDVVYERRQCLFVAYCRPLGIDPEGFDGLRRKNTAHHHLKAVDRAEEFTPDVMERLTRYTLACLGWRKGGTTPLVADVLNAYAEWKRDGEPDKPPPKGSNGYASPPLITDREDFDLYGSWGKPK